MLANKEARLIETLEPLAMKHGLELVTVEIAGTAKNPILRVYLDTPQGGITLDQLAAAQDWLDAAIEDADPFMCSYVLEVSSPGIDRPLRKIEDFERFAGEEVRIYPKSGEACAKIAGVLKGLDGTDVVVDDRGEDRIIAFDRIKKANIIGRVDFNKKRFEELEEDAAIIEDGKEE